MFVYCVVCVLCCLFIVLFVYCVICVLCLFIVLFVYCVVCVLCCLCIVFVYCVICVLCLFVLFVGVPVTTEEVRYGLRVGVVILPASPVLKTPRALEVVGPRGFGFHVDYREPRPLI